MKFFTLITFIMGFIMGKYGVYGIIEGLNGNRLAPIKRVFKILRNIFLTAPRQQRYNAGINTFIFNE